MCGSVCGLWGHVPAQACICTTYCGVSMLQLSPNLNLLRSADVSIAITPPLYCYNT